MLLFISSIIISIAYNKSELLYSEEDACSTVTELPLDKPTIVFSAGGGFWPYYLGIAKYIKDHYDLSDVYFVGTSAGGLSALALSQPVELDDVMVNSLSVTDEISQYILGVFSLQWSKLYKKNFLIGLDGHYKKTNHLFLAASRITLFGFEKRYFIADSNAEAIADAAIVSCWLPFITAPFFQPLFHIGRSYYVDGFWSGFDKTNKQNTIIIYPRTFTKMPLSWHWLWLDREHNMNLYRLGYEHASKNCCVFSILQKLT
jgi:hypothetical protein